MGVLLISAVATIGLVVAGSRTVYNNLHAADEERGWIDHSQLVITSLQTQTARLDRVDYSLQLFAATGEQQHLKSAISTLSNMNVSLVQLQEMVKDNQDQGHHIDQFDKTLQSLTNLIGSMDSHNRVLPEKQILEARNILGIVLQEERGLLHDRNEMFRKSSDRSFLLSISYFGFSLLITLVLFIFLFRDALRRSQDEKKLFSAKRELESTVNKLTTRAEESVILTNARDELQLCTTAHEAHECATRHLNLLLPGTSGATLVINNSRRMVEIGAHWGEPANLLDGFDPDTCCGLRGGKLRWRRKGRTELHCGHFIGTPPDNYLCVPLAAHGETQGFLFVLCDTPATLALAEQRESLIQEMAELASLSIAALNLRSKLEGQSIRDGLTGLFNRHFMEIALERELHRAARHRTPLAVLMLDVDHFKQFNDTYGHEAGDIVLRSVAECYRRMVRTEDVICRYGGEEFVVIMPDASEEVALRRAQMIREAVSDIRTQFRGEALRSITVSVGIALYPSNAIDGNDLIRSADRALYRAKHEGRNQVILADAPQHVITT
ncbi:MAG: sensor domain-containing diguanylate cyclase [Edaphobacter sp.]|uniref:sensor domain-containing diguanylate cyclase n=1 Tax=Edaphobacter sp. TaxID=1934404 RepID=UPI0023910E18|nr:sensor domain-containing diguanylate cyclase [Edaphobacter sp.]MDE1176600.1 sensor domain-containing diguanylate cyclase [Edaphobacter sp.]